MASMNRFLIQCAILLSLCASSLAQQPSAVQPTRSAVAKVPSPEKIWADLMEGNKRFVAGKTRSYNVVSLREKLASSQQPNVIILSCSDSRTAPESVFDQNLGDLFVIRTAGNVADPIGVGSIEYAVAIVKSTVLVVLGHSKCGAVIAACSGDKMPSRNLEAIVDKIAPAVADAKSHSKADDLVETAIRENVHQSAKDLLANSEIIRNAVKAGTLTVIEAEYQLGSGQVVRLDTPSRSQN